MKHKFITFLNLLIAASAALAQGTFQYDQESLNHPLGANVLYNLQSNEPIGQSFTPLLSSVGFVQFEPFDGHPNNGLGATLYVNLRSNSMSGPILNSTDPVFVPDNFGDVTNFLFSTPVAVVPGTTYFFEVVAQSGDLWRLNALQNLYPGGTMFSQGIALAQTDLWFREGVIVPEPSAGLISFVIGATWICVRRRR